LYAGTLFARLVAGAGHRVSRLFVRNLSRLKKLTINPSTSDRCVCLIMGSSFLPGVLSPDFRNHSLA
jgi:hypothetical protein